MRQSFTMMKPSFKEMEEKLLMKREELIDILTEIASYRAAEEEIAVAIETLRGADEEIKHYQPAHINKVAVYHSSNVVLYSYILYGVIPGAFSKRVYIRPSKQSAEILNRIHQLLNGDGAWPIEILNLSQRKFNQHIQGSDMVIFTGRYENSLDVMEQHPNALFLYFGSGVNPFIVGPDADIETAGKSAVDARTFNTGQDCMCPNVYFVHRSKQKEFIDKLISEVNQLTFGKRKESKAQINPIFYEGVADSISCFLSEYNDFIIFGGNVNIEDNVVETTILVSEIKSRLPANEFFGPVFNVVIYDENSEILEWLYLPENIESTMGISVFGAPLLAEVLTSQHMVAIDASLFDIESGNNEFGGYGCRANYVRFGNYHESRPLLISREVALLYGQKS
ncbi:aldehyde dehydrogenase (NAD+) [Bacillus sp. TE9106W]|nr:aldehyde dehydrogenase family protein [Bacillus cereus]